MIYNLNMKIRIACIQFEIIPGRPDLNTKNILSWLQKAKSQSADIVLFPEMSVPGYMIGDLWEQQSFLNDCGTFGEEIISASEGTTVIFGNVALDPDRINEDGRVRKYNAAFAAQNGRPIRTACGNGYIAKTSLPNYREFDDKRYFCGAQQKATEEDLSIQQFLQPVCISVKGTELKAGVMLCEDGWTENYDLNVPKILRTNGAQILFNISCSPFSLGKNGKRHRLFGSQAKELGIPILYCNNTGVQNNGKGVFTFDGCSTIYSKDGKIVSDTRMYEETMVMAEFDSETGCIHSDHGVSWKEMTDQAEVIYKVLSYGTKHFLDQCGIRKMAVGVSGGIDSAVTSAMYAKILGPENVLLINMPSRFNSSTTKDAAKKLSEILEANYCVIPIQESVELTQKQFETTPIKLYKTGEEWNLKLTTAILENIQARDRGARVLAGAAAAFGGAFSCNSNKSETTIGYATFYGDISGALAMIGDLWKHQVYALGRYLNDQVYAKPVIPEEIFNIMPSAELSDAQTVGKGGDPLVYPYHDYLFAAFEELWNKKSPADILGWYQNGVLEDKIGCEKGIVKKIFPDAQSFMADLERWWKLYAGFSVAKRIQAPPILSISRRAYGFDNREAQLSPYFSLEYLHLKKDILDGK